MEHGLDDVDVRWVIIAAIRVVQDEHITGVDIAGESLGDAADGVRQRPHDDRDVRGLRNQL